MLTDFFCSYFYSNFQNFEVGFLFLRYSTKNPSKNSHMGQGCKINREIYLNWQKLSLRNHKFISNNYEKMFICCSHSQLTTELFLGRNSSEKHPLRATPHFWDFSYRFFIKMAFLAWCFCCYILIKHWTFNINGRKLCFIFVWCDQPPLATPCFQFS